MILGRRGGVRKSLTLFDVTLGVCVFLARDSIISFILLQVFVFCLCLLRCMFYTNDIGRRGGVRKSLTLFDVTLGVCVFLAQESISALFCSRCLCFVCVYILFSL